VRCPCGLGPPYEACCAPLHGLDVAAPTAERVMRARYSAFALEDDRYLLASWHPSTRPGSVGFDPAQRWTGLEVLATTSGGLLDAEGTVEFRARFEQGGRPGELHEVSRFVRDAGRWAYVGPVALTRR
jgi:SEC-C motif-containing protein